MLIAAMGIIMSTIYKVLLYMNLKTNRILNNNVRKGISFM